MFRYRLVDQRVLAMWRNLAAARLMAALPSGKAPTTRVRRRISCMTRSSGLLARMRAHADPGGAEQRTQGPQRHALAAAVGTAAAVFTWRSLIQRRAVGLVPR